MATGAILGACWLWKNAKRVYVDTNDHSMEPAYPAGNYWLNVDPGCIEVNWAVAFYPPGQMERMRVAWVVAKEGQRVALSDAPDGGKLLLVDGQPTTNGLRGWRPESASTLTARGFCQVLDPRPKGSQTEENLKNEIVVPRGCVFLLAEKPDEDSFRYGPIPVRNIVGRLKSGLIMQ